MIRLRPPFHGLGMLLRSPEYNRGRSVEAPLLSSVAMIQRMIRAASLEAAVYEEVERDPEATSQALTVVSVVGLALGIAIGLDRGFSLSLVAGGMALVILGWLATAVVTYLVGTLVFKTPATQTSVNELLRTVGFAQSPGILLIFSAIPAWVPSYS